MHSTGDAAVAGRCKTPDNYLRLHSAIGYVTPKDMLAGHQQEIQAERDRKLDAAKEQRKNRRPGAIRFIHHAARWRPTMQN